MVERRVISEPQVGEGPSIIACRAARGKSGKAGRSEQLTLSGAILGNPYDNYLFNSGPHEMAPKEKCVKS